MIPTPGQPIPVIIVASWYPGVQDPAAGRFVADQAEALAATGRVAPFIASFEDVRLDGDRLLRGEDLAPFVRHRRTALDQHPAVINHSAWGVREGIGTARVPSLVGIGRATPGGTDGEHRRQALTELASRMDLSGPLGVVHAHTAYPDGYAAAELARRLGWPLVITEHATFVARQLGRPEERRRYLEAVEEAARFLAVSDALAGELSAAIPGLDGKLDVMPNTVPLDRYVPTALDGRNPEELLFVGYRKPIKGIATLIRAFVDVRAVRPGATLRLIGRSPTEEVEDEWVHMARALGVGDAVHFDDPLDRDGVAEAMTRASVLVHPSVRETFGMTTIEALASGMPVVAARSGGISSMLEDRRLGELVAPYDSRALSKAVLRTLDRRDSFDPQFLRAAVEPYAATTVAARLVALYEELLASAGATARPPRGRLQMGGCAAPVPERILVVGHDTSRAAMLLGDMPPQLLRRMVLVTAGDKDVEDLPDAFGAVVLSGERIVHELGRVGLLGPRGSLPDRVQRVARNPGAALRRRLRPAQRARMRTEAVVEGTRAALKATPVRDLLSRGPTSVVCVDAVDYEAVAPLLASRRIVPMPGGPIWLADAWVSSQVGLEPASRSSTISARRSPTTAQS